jgi:hypothetical protein
MREMVSSGDNGSTTVHRSVDGMPTTQADTSTLPFYSWSTPPRALPALERVLGSGCTRAQFHAWQNRRGRLTMSRGSRGDGGE